MAESAQRSSTALFDVFLRLRPSYVADAARFLDVEAPSTGEPTHITIRPPANDFRKRAVEKFEFTRVFQEDSAQLELFKSVGLPEAIEGVLGRDGSHGRDGLLATLGVTGSGKSHTILGSKSQRGLTQLSLDVLFQTVQSRIADVEDDDDLLQSICSSDVSEAQMMSAGTFLELSYGDGTGASRRSRMTSRGATPMLDTSIMSIPGATSRKHLPRISTLPQYPNVDEVAISCDESAQYAVVISMYEVYNDRIFDLLSSSSAKSAIQKRRGLLFKSTEHCPDRKVVAGLRKVVCASLDEALMVLETGLIERRVAGTGSNAVSSRSHGFFCVEVKKRSDCGTSGAWSSSTLTIVDLAGSERARSAKTTGSTLAEAGKINESLMYLGQCMQLQSDNADLSKPLSIVPFRQCKLTELLFSNSFPSSTATPLSQTRRQAQKSIMIVTADPHGDFNATSQILRYSALAREVTVPRIPSVTASILSSGPANVRTVSGRATPSRVSSTTADDSLDAAHAEIARLRAELDAALFRAEDEERRRREAESAWVAAVERSEGIEAEVREEVFAEMEGRLAVEMQRWRGAVEAERERDEARVDAKLDLLARGLEDTTNPSSSSVRVFEDGDAERLAELQRENEALRARVEAVERERGMRSPSKKMRVLKARKWEGSGVGFENSP